MATGCDGRLPRASSGRVPIRIGGKARLVASPWRPAGENVTVGGDDTLEEEAHPGLAPEWIQRSCERNSTIAVDFRVRSHAIISPMSDA
jgi:hypothetical protein